MKLLSVTLRTGRALVCLYLVVFLSVGLHAQQRPRQTQQRLNIAVMDFDARGGITTEEAATLSDAFQTEMVSMDLFVVVDRQRIKQILEEQGFQQSEACSQVECIVEAGKILKVERMFAGTIGKVGQLFNVNIQTIDIATAQIVSNRSRQHRGEIEELLSEIIPDMARQMASDLTGRPYEPRGSGGGWVWWVLGILVVGGGGAGAYLFLNKDKDTDEVGTAGATELPRSPDFPQ